MTFALAFNGRRKAKPKATPRAPRRMEHLVLHLPAMNAGDPEHWVLQLPIVTHADNAGGGRINDFNSSKRARSQIDTVLMSLQTQLRGIDRERIDRITLVRFSPGKLDAHDNLRQAFKHVLDAVCVWIVCGSGDFNRRSIGKYDDQLLGTGRVTCQYEQQTHETDRRLQGIQIRLRLATPSPTQAL